MDMDNSEELQIHPKVGDTILVFNRNHMNIRRFLSGSTPELIVNETPYTYQFASGYVCKKMRYITWFWTETDEIIQRPEHYVR